MENNQRNSRKRLNSLILLVAFTAVMLIVSTYAWFSTQKSVTLTGIQGTVKVAEGLQISLDASIWKNEIDFSEFTSGATSTSTEYFAAEGATLGDPLAGGANTNVIPTELLPASTTGEIEEDDGQTINMYRGINEDGNKLEEIALVTEDDNAKFYAIDLYLQNSSAGTNADPLRLTSNSTISISGNQTTGLQNTLRVALGITPTGVAVDGINGQTQILAGAAGNEITQVAIWEPNSDAHSAYVQNNQKVSMDGSTWDAITSTTQHYTYAVTADAATATEVANVYDWSDETLAPQYTLQTSATTAISDPVALKANDAAGTAITIPANTYVKARLYIWLEGQDVDCINQASYGGTVTVNFGFDKPGQQS